MAISLSPMISAAEFIRSVTGAVGCQGAEKQGKAGLF